MMRRVILLSAVVALVGLVATPASAGSVGSCGAASSGWVLVSYVGEYPYAGWESTTVWTTWIGWVDEETWYAETGMDGFETYDFFFGPMSASVDNNGDGMVCMKMATPVPTQEPTLASGYLFDFDVILVDNVRGQKTG